MRQTLLLPLVLLSFSGCVRIHPQFERQWEDLYGCARSTQDEAEAQQKCADNYADAELTGRLATVVPMSNGNVRLDVDGVMDNTSPRDGRRVVTCILTPPIDTRRINAMKAWNTWVTLRGSVRQVASNRAGNTVVLAPCELVDTADGAPAAAASKLDSAHTESSHE